MALIDSVRQLCERLRPLGWGDLLARHGLDLGAADLQAELERALPGIRRDVPGFADFHADATRGIEPGIPAQSLLFHALASPGVHPTPDGTPAADPHHYPTLEELDSLENYVYARAGRRLEDFPANAVVAVFAYQYRTGTRSAHGLYADLAFSRTGVARVGTTAERYDAARRSHWVQPENGESICVMPARYAAFLAVPQLRGPDTALLGGTVGAADANRRFLIAFHKLFPGSECLAGLNLAVDFAEFHRNEKLRRIHTNGHIPALPGFDVNQPPFVRDSVNAPGEMVQLRPVGTSILVTPIPRTRLVRTATQRRATTARDELVRFAVPAAAPGQTNRFWSSYDIQAEGGGRAAPEYVNIRHRVTTAGDGTQTIDDINLLPENQFNALLAAGGYEAAHFIDDTADGCVAATVGGLPNGLGDPARVRAAYSLVTAPDFFPLMDQITIYEWARGILGGIPSQFSQSSPEPLARGRTPSNPSIPRPGTANPAFDRSDRSMTAVTSRVVVGPVTSQLHPAPAVSDASASFLPDAASNVFAPGWDVSLGVDGQGDFHTAFGLGSPFPEDAKLCAALNSFWPAAAPDATRTFGLQASPTAQPLLDEELGFHPNHPLAQSGTVASRPGWDGEFGPFLELVGGQRFVNFADPFRSDYVSNALGDLIRLTPLLNVTAEEMIRRMEALRACVRVLPPAGDMVSTTRLFLTRAEQVSDWAARPDRGDPHLTGRGYLYVFVETSGNGQPVPGDLRRVRQQVTVTRTCQVGMDGRKVTGIAFQENADPFQFRAHP